ncbi:MAG TPA: TlpA disulfide reductase family protein [Candidatus Acidoferrum sp.]
MSPALHHNRPKDPATHSTHQGERLAKSIAPLTTSQQKTCILPQSLPPASATIQTTCALFKKPREVYTPRILSNSNKKTSALFTTLSILLFFALIAALASPARAQEASPATPDSGPVIRFVRNPDQAPDFKLEDLDGKPLSLTASHGKVILLNFWATWCGPCRAEIPDLIELQKKYADRLQIIGLDVDDDDSTEVKKFVAANGINYPIGMATNEIRVQYGGVAALPTSFVLDDQGRVVQKHEGLRNPLLYEYEIRALIGLPIPARVETFEDTGEIFLKHADRASTLPGVDMTKLTPEQRTVALHRFNAEGCTCGCQFTLAQCRIYDRNCPISKARTTKIIAEVTGHDVATPAHEPESPKVVPATDAPNPNPTQHTELP